jgi:hypothetical protein
MGYSGLSLFPIKNNDSEWAFRAWINYGTSVDRVVTVSYDSIFDKMSFINEFGTLSSKRNNKFIYNILNVVPKSGYNAFFNKIDSLELIKYKSQENFEIKRMHTPFSLYVIEIKFKGQYNQFSFRTYFPLNLVDTTFQVENQYEKIENLLFDEFDIKFYLK